MARTISVFKAAVLPPRKLTKADRAAITDAGCRMFLQELEELEQRAHRLNLTVTALALNNAKNACGWEIAGDIVSAGKAARGERRE